MVFKYGQTRFVLVFDNYVVKIARIRLIHALEWLGDYLTGRVTKKSYQEGKSVLRIFLATMMNGVSANLSEYFYSRRYPDDHRVFHTVFCLIGLISIQHKGEELTCRQRLAKYWEENPGLEGGDLIKMKQFGIDKKGEVRILDYGLRTDCDRLAQLR